MFCRTVLPKSLLNSTWYSPSGSMKKQGVMELSTRSFVAAPFVSGRTVTLVGFMGSGKSTVGRVLAMRLKWPLKDTDALIEEREGMSIAKVFAQKGEPYFRAKLSR